MGPPEPQKATCMKDQLRLYILEILAMTFDANFDQLNVAMDQIKPGTYARTRSISSQAERAQLVKLSTYVRRFQEHYKDTHHSDGQRVKRRLRQKHEQAGKTDPLNAHHAKHLRDFIVDPANAGLPYRATLLGHWESNPYGWSGDMPVSFLKGLFTSFRAIIEMSEWTTDAERAIL
ncbi:hypothetical protein NX059_007147 [Plenodomus lindquistii]|nr:hypothetical protein NX059_007147 [Plenodomus lindquistii]